MKHVTFLCIPAMHDGMPISQCKMINHQSMQNYKQFIYSRPWTCKWPSTFRIQQRAEYYMLCS